MSHYNSEFFGSKRISEQLVEAAKERLDEIGHPQLKKQLDDALFGNDEPRTAVNFGDSKGLLI
jgi:hypothetical protein